MRFVPALLLLIAAVPARAAAPPLVGTWFGYGQPWDKSAMYLDTMEANGRFHAHHRTCVKGKATDQVEQGAWTLNRNILTIRIETVNGQFQPRVDDYKLLSVTAKQQHYVYIPMNFAYTSQRVAPGYKMPACDLVS
jgi:hypothetical protein